MTKTQILDALTRAGHTLWQAFLAALAVTWAASGLDVSQVTDVDSAKRFGIAAFGAVVAALLSAVKSTVAAVVAKPGEYVGEHETSSAPTIPTQGA